MRWGHSNVGGVVECIAKPCGATNSSSLPRSWVLHKLFCYWVQSSTTTKNWEDFSHRFSGQSMQPTGDPVVVRIESLRHSKTPLRHQRNCRHQQRPQESGRKSQRLRHRICKKTKKTWQVPKAWHTPTVSDWATLVTRMSGMSWWVCSTENKTELLAIPLNDVIVFLTQLLQPQSVSNQQLSPGMLIQSCAPRQKLAVLLGKGITSMFGHNCFDCPPLLWFGHRPHQCEVASSNKIYIYILGDSKQFMP